VAVILIATTEAVLRGDTHTDTGMSGTATDSDWRNSRQKACIRPTTREGRCAESIRADEHDRDWNNLGMTPRRRRVTRRNGKAPGQFEPSRGFASGRRDWTRTNDPHHVKVVL